MVVGHTGEETGQRASERGRGRFGCQKASPVGPGRVTLGSLTPTNLPLSSHEQRRQGSTEGSQASPWGWFLGLDGAQFLDSPSCLALRFLTNLAVKPCNHPLLTEKANSSTVSEQA